VALVAQEHHASPLVEGGILAVFVLVIARQILALYENVRLNRELAHLAGQLSGKLMTKQLEGLQRRDSAFSRSREAGTAEGITPAGEVHVGRGLSDATRPDSIPQVRP